MERAHLQSRLERLEQAEKQHREQLRRERQKREEAERRLYADRQGSIRKNIRSIMAASPSASAASPRAGEEGDAAALQLQHHRRCLADAEEAIRRLEGDLLRELDARQQLERAAGAGADAVDGARSAAPSSAATPESSSLLFGNAATAARERREADDLARGLRERLEAVSAQLEEERTGHAATKQKLLLHSPAARANGAGAPAATPGRGGGADADDGDHIRVPRHTMQTIREQLISLSAERDALLRLGDGSEMAVRALAEVAESSAMLERVRAAGDRDAAAAAAGGPAFNVGRLTELLRSKELVHLKLVEALRQEKARTAAMEALLGEYHGAEERYRESEEGIARLRRELGERAEAEARLREAAAAGGGGDNLRAELDAARRERDRAQAEAAEMRENLNEVVGELYQCKETVNRLEKEAGGEGAQRKGSFAF